MKQRYITLVLSIFTFSLHAQMINVPDQAFVNWLNTNGFSTCMTGNMIDGSCPAVLNTTSISIASAGITDLTGIEAFVNLIDLNCSLNNLTGLPQLPGSLIYLSCSYNQIGNLSNLPSNLSHLDCVSNNMGYLDLSSTTNLTELDCSTNNLNSISTTFPSTLHYLYCASNNLTSLGPLPASAIDIDCSSNHITALSTLPSGLGSLNCSSNNITSLPALPASLQTLDCSSNQLDSISVITSSSLTILNCSNQPLALPALPSTLEQLICNANQLTSLPALPVGLMELYCENNQLSALPQLPPILKRLNCRDNVLTSLPSLPNSLMYLHCINNQLGTLTAQGPLLNSVSCDDNNLVSLTLSSALEYLTCDNNQLTQINGTTAALISLSCAHNLLTSLPAMNDTLTSLLINDNPSVFCLPEIKKITNSFYWGNTGITCFPNVIDLPFSTVPPASNVPLCNNLNNPGCSLFWNIAGAVFNDVNADCLQDTGDASLKLIKLNLFSNGILIQQTFTNSIGMYSFDTGIGTYDYKVDTSGTPFGVICPPNGMNTSALTLADSLDYDRNFSLQCKPGFDLSVNSITRTSGVVRPGNITGMNVLAGDASNLYNMHCASGIQGSIMIVINGPAAYSGAASGSMTPQVNGDTLIYNISDFGTYDFMHAINFLVAVDTNAQIGDQLCFDISVLPVTGDYNPGNNILQHCFNVINSFDPNEKEVSPTGIIDSTQEWLTYTIHFQNTGNAVAQHIYIADTLDNSLNAGSIKILSYSHELDVHLHGNRVIFNFPNINLPDSITDEPNSHGYVQYKVRLNDNLPTGTQINNTAFIYFDFNNAIQTNTASNTIGMVTYINAKKPESEFSIFPNPTKSQLHLSGMIKHGTIRIYSLIGELFIETPYADEIDVSALPSGIYFIRIDNSNTAAVKKFIKL